MVDLKDFLPGKEKSAEYYWALVLEPEWIQAGIWQIKEKKAEVVSVSPPTAWGEDEELVSAADTALSSVVSHLPEDAKEPSKTVFGVSSTWVSEGQIKPEYLEKLKLLCSKLSLEPTGFVILPEAIAHLTKSQEGSPLSAVTLGVGSENLEVSVFRLGNLVGTANVARSVSIVDDVSEGLARFASGETLPSRFLLYDGKEGELEEVKQALLSAQWDEYEKLKFLHTPKVEIIAPEKKVIATCLAGAAEIADVGNVYLEVAGEEEESKEEPVKEELVLPVTPIKPEEVGFVIGQDIAEVKKIETEEKEPTPSRPSRKRFSFDILNKVKFMKPDLKGLVGKKALVVAAAAFGLFALLVFVLWWFLPKAEVIIYVAPKKLEQKLAILIDIKAQNPDFAKGVLPGRVVETQVSGEKTKSTTGSKEVGERAKGTVEVRNGTAEQVKLASGTVILVADRLEFTLDTATSVSAAISTTTPGTTTVEVTATDIGAEFNLVKDESFAVGNYPKAEVEAIATADFSGGSSRDIAAVSLKDQETLEEELREELLDKAAKELSGVTGEEEFFIEESLVATVTSRNFSYKVGDEASSLALDLTLSVSSLVVEKMHLSDLASEVLKEQVPSGFVLREEQIEIKFELEDTGEEAFELSAEIVANLLPEVKTEEIAEKIAGRYPPLALDFLMTVPGFVRAEIDLKPPLPGRLGVLPHLARNIKIELSAER